jgi:hypothetical protein
MCSGSFLAIGPAASRRYHPLMKLKTLFLSLVAVVVGALLGGGSAFWMVAGAQSLGGSVTSGGWGTSRQIGSPSADPWTRALVARAGLLALAKSETIYYSRAKDDAGQNLSERCTYQIKGGPMPARWWSITLYAGDNHLAFNQDQAASIDATRHVRDTTDAYQALISTARGDSGNWLSSNGAGEFVLTIRLYNPDASVQADPEIAPLPSVTRIACEGAKP